MGRLESMMVQAVNSDAAGLDGQAFAARHGDTVSGRVRRKRRGRAAGGAVAAFSAVGAVALVAPTLGGLRTVPATPLATPTSSEAECLTETVFDDIASWDGDWDETYPRTFANHRSYAFGLTDRSSPVFYIWDRDRQSFLMSIQLDSADSATVTLADGTEIAVDPSDDERGADEAVAVEWEGVGSFSIDFGPTKERFVSGFSSDGPFDRRAADRRDATVTGTPPCGPPREPEPASPSPSPTKSSTPDPSHPTTPWPSAPATPLPSVTPSLWEDPEGPSPSPESLIPD